MKTISSLFVAVALISTMSCNQGNAPAPSSSEQTATTPGTGQSGVSDDVSNPNIVQVAVKSADHSTLVTAVKAAELVDALSNAGPFTVFAPVNAAFDKLPAGTVESLLKPENKEKLADILQYHVYVGVITEEGLTDGRILGQVNGGNVKVEVKDGKPVLNGNAHILGSVQASNGVIYVIDEVLLPPSQ